LVGPVRALRRIKLPTRIPQALTIEQVSSLLTQCDKLRGCFLSRIEPTVQRHLYWRSLVMGAWDTALRLGDLKKLERQWIAPDGTVGLVQSKTQRVHYLQFRPATMSVIDELIGGRTGRPIWSVLNKKNFYVGARQLFAKAGVPGSIPWLRRASATYVDKEHPGTAWLHLGHANPGLDRTNYTDPSIARRRPSLAPEIPAFAIGGAKAS